MKKRQKFFHIACLVIISTLLSLFVPSIQGNTIDSQAASGEILYLSKKKPLAVEGAYTSSYEKDYEGTVYHDIYYFPCILSRDEPESWVEWKLDGTYNVLSGTALFPEENHYSAKIILVVEVDNKIVYESPAVTYETEPYNFRVNINGGRYIKIYAKRTGYFSGVTVPDFMIDSLKVTKNGIKDICQMPYWGNGGGYLIGFESISNAKQAYRYEMFVMDLSLLAAGSPTPWVHATGKVKLAEGKTFWTIWQPKYGYYLTLFRLYDKNGKIIDEVSYGFANAY